MLAQSKMGVSQIAENFRSMISLHELSIIDGDDNDLQIISEFLPHLKAFRLPWGTSDVGLGHVAKMTSLEHLSVSPKFRDSGVPYLLSNTNLRRLDLQFSSITDWGVQQLSVLSSLTALNLEYCLHVTGTGLAALTSLEKLTVTIEAQKISKELAQSSIKFVQNHKKMVFCSPFISSPTSPPYLN